MKKPKRTIRYYALFNSEGVQLSKWDTRKEKLLRAAKELKRNTNIAAIYCRRRTFLKPEPVTAQAGPAQDANLPTPR